MLTAENTFFNFWKNKAVHLEEGEEICSKCNGDGIIGIFTDRPQNMNPKNVCNKCWGDGKLDWCEKATGKPCGLSSSSSSSSRSETSITSAKKVNYGRKEDVRRRRNYLSEVRRKRKSKRIWNYEVYI